MEAFQQRILSWAIQKITAFIEINPNDINVSSILTSGQLSFTNIRLRPDVINETLTPDDIRQRLEIVECLVGSLSISLLPLLSSDVNSPIEIKISNIAAEANTNNKMASNSNTWSVWGAITSTVTSFLPPNPANRPIKISLENLTLKVSANGQSSIAINSKTQGSSELEGNLNCCEACGERIEGKKKQVELNGRLVTYHPFCFWLRTLSFRVAYAFLLWFVAGVIVVFIAVFLGH